MKPRLQVLHINDLIILIVYIKNLCELITIEVSLKSKANICHEIKTFEWGMREFAIYDNNGYIVQFVQPASEISREE